MIRDSQDKLFAFLDFEGCNLCLNECHNLPFQAGCIMYRNGQIEEELDLKIIWDKELKVSKKAAEITKYNPQIILEQGRPASEVLDILLNRFKQADIIAGYNLIGYDNYIFQAFCRELNQPVYNIVPKMMDIFPIAKAIKLEIPLEEEDFIAWQYRLFHRIEKGIKTRPEILARELGIEVDPFKLHDALEDLKLLVSIWEKLKYLIKYNGSHI